MLKIILRNTINGSKIWFLKFVINDNGKANLKIPLRFNIYEDLRTQKSRIKGNWEWDCRSEEEGSGGSIHLKKFFELFRV